MPSDEEILALALAAPLRECKHAVDKFTGSQQVCRFAIECQRDVYCIVRRWVIFRVEHLGECPVTYGARRASERG